LFGCSFVIHNNTFIESILCYNFLLSNKVISVGKYAKYVSLSECIIDTVGVPKSTLVSKSVSKSVSQWCLLKSVVVLPAIIKPSSSHHLATI